MSVDDRLREALERSAADFAPRAAGDVEVLITTARRRRALRRLTAGAAASLVLGIGAGALVHQQSGSAAPPVLPAQTHSTTPSPAPRHRTDADRQLAANLVGTWITDVVSPQTATAAMVRTGTTAYRDQVLNVLHLPGTVRLTFEDLAYRAELGAEKVDEGTWSIRDGKLILAPYCTTSCQIVLAPTLHEGRLSLSLLEDHSPDVDRVPSAAHATVIYGSAPFHRPQ